MFEGQVWQVFVDFLFGSSIPIDDCWSMRDLLDLVVVQLNDISAVFYCFSDFLIQFLTFNSKHIYERSLNSFR
jgi:hypothetical protein